MLITATYTVETLNFTGGFMQNTYVPRDAMLPQDGLNNLSTTYYKIILKMHIHF